MPSNNNSITNNNESVGSRLTLLWNEVLSRQQPINLSELWKDHLRISQELDTLKLSGTSIKRPTDRLTKLPAFLKWAQKMGIEFEGIDVLNSINGLSLSTNKTRNDGEIVLSVPHSALLSVDNSAQIETFKKILDDEMLNAMENVALAMMVAHELLRKEESEWAPYIHILPTEFQTPIFYSVEQFQLLKPSPVFESALLMYRQIARQFVYFYLRILGDVGEKGKKHLSDHSNCSHPFLGSPFTPRNFTFDLYRWCVSIVSTRINVVPSQIKMNEDGTSKMIPALIPFIDFANHANLSQKPGSVFFCPESKCIKLQLNCDFEIGQELCIYYGKRTNSKFLLHNGFVPASTNPDDLYELKIGLSSSAPNFQAKVDFLKQQDILPNIQHQKNCIYLFQLPPEPTELSIKQSALWIFALTFVTNSIDELNDNSKINSIENEQKASKFLADRFRILLAGYGGNTIDEDKNDEIKQAIDRLKKCEQRLLADYLQITQKTH